MASIKQLPADTGHEVAFAGRSNVGKSSVINKLTNRKALARTSKQPGRTRELNYFSYDEQTHIVDLPGYGYARVNADMQKAWAKLLDSYLRQRQSLKGVFLIMDIRHPLTQFDQQMFEDCSSCNIPLHIVLNKSDKLSRNAAMMTMAKVKSELQLASMSVQLFSALKGDGLDTARNCLAGWLFSDKE